MKCVVLTMLVSASLMLAQSEVKRREERQQDRIANGVKSGELTPHETAKLERQERLVGKEIRADRKANGGKLDKAEKKDINRQQDKLSREIYRKKHN